MIKAIGELLEAHKRGELEGVTVTVDNDSMYAYRHFDGDVFGERSERVFGFDGGPQGMLVEVLKALGIDATEP